MRIARGILHALSAVMAVFTLFFVAILIFKTAGITPYVVMSGSMEPSIQTGSLCFINTHVEYDEIQAGDVIAFQIATGDMVTHRVTDVTDDGLITQGDNSDNSDGVSTTKENYRGKNFFSIPYAGRAVHFLTTRRGMIIYGTAILAVLCLSFLVPEKEKGAGPAQGTK